MFANELDNDESSVNDTDGAPAIFTTAFICRISSSCGNVLSQRKHATYRERNGRESPWRARLVVPFLRRA